MAILIDGYNLIHAAGLLPRGVGPGSLGKARRALLNFLSQSLTDQEQRRAVVVFDAHDYPRDAPRQLQHGAIQVRYAVAEDDADTLLEELIRADSAPRRLLVISSDRRLHRAANRRRATPVESELWYESLLQRRTAPASPPTTAKPSTVSPDEVQYWLDQFHPDDSPPAAPPEELSDDEMRRLLDD